jgi:thymidylate synthase
VDVTKAWETLCSLVLLAGRRHASRAGPTTEVVGVSVCVSDTRRPLLANTRRNISSTYASGELLWYLSGTNDPEMICAYAPRYREFCEPGGAPYGAYGPRLMPALAELVRRLRDDPDTRHGVASIWRHNDLWAWDKRDVPCTLTIQMLVRDDALHTIATMRSNDLWLGTPYDMFCFCTIHNLVASMLDLRPGTYVHQAGSLHLYEKDVEKAREAMVAGRFAWNDRQPELAAWSSSPSWDDVRAAVASEQTARLGRGEPPPPVHPTMRDLVAACATRWTTVHDDAPWNDPGMKEQSDAYRGRNRSDGQDRAVRETTRAAGGAG